MVRSLIILLPLVLLCGGLPAASSETANSGIVVLVPGTTGSVLRSPTLNQIVWGLGRNLIRPHRRGYEMARDINSSGDEGAFLAMPLEEIRLLWMKKPVYGPVLAALEEIGWRRGDFSAPSPAADLFLFAYDFRLDNLVSVGRLAAGLERIRRARGAERLPVTLLCQSNGSHICRYLVRYGGASMAEAESGRRRPATLDVKRVVLFSASNAGALRMLQLLDRGRHYLPPVGRKIAPEVLFTWPSIFQDLPMAEDLFVDVDGRPVDVDLFDPDSWTEHGWSAFSDDARQRLSKRDVPALRTESERRDYLASVLPAAKRFRALLARDLQGPERPAYFLVGNGNLATSRRGVIVRAPGEASQTLYFGDDRVAADPVLRRATSADGDGHATLESVMSLAESERDAMVEPLFTPEGKHFEMLLSPETLAWLRRVVGRPIAPTRPGRQTTER